VLSKPEIRRLLALERFREVGTTPFTAKTVELPFLKANGESIFVEVSMSAFKQNGRWNAVGLIRNITERKEQEKLIMESRQKFMALFSENPEAVIFCDKDFRVVDVNSRFIKFFSYSLDEVKGKSLNDIIVPEDRNEEADLIDEKVQNEFVECNTIRIRKDGSQVNVSMSAAPVIVNGNVIGYIKVYKDISDIVTIEEALNRALQKTELLNEKLNTIGSFTRHDVWNKLSAINGYTYLIKKHLAGNSEMQGYLRQIEEVTTNIIRILDFAKTYEMLGNQELAYTDVGKMIQDAVSLFSDLKGVRIINECNGFEVLADSLFMEVFHNLIDNSLKYGEKISQIRIYVQKNLDGTTDLIYEDDGVGIEADTKKMLFQKGFGKGTDYGLYLIQRICDMYGWTIQENGQPGKGVLFVIRITTNH